MEGVSRARKPPKRREAGRADILEVSRMGSHEVSEALVSKRATREAEREEMGYRGEPRGGAEAQRRKTHHAAPRPGRTRVGDEPAVGSIVPSDVAAAVTAGGGTAGQRKQSVRTESEAPPPGPPPRLSPLGEGGCHLPLAHPKAKERLVPTSPQGRALASRLQASPTQLNSRSKGNPREAQLKVGVPPKQTCCACTRVRAGGWVCREPLPDVAGPSPRTRPEPSWGEPATGQEEAGSWRGSGQEEEPQEQTLSVGGGWTT